MKPELTKEELLEFGRNLIAAAETGDSAVLVKLRNGRPRFTNERLADVPFFRTWWVVVKFMGGSEYEFGEGEDEEELLNWANDSADELEMALEEIVELEGSKHE